MEFGIYKWSKEAHNLIAELELEDKHNQHESPNSGGLLCSLINDAKAKYQVIIASHNFNAQNANFEFNEMNDFSDTEETLEKSTGNAVLDEIDLEISILNQPTHSNGDYQTGECEVKLPSYNKELDKQENIVTSWNNQQSIIDKRNFIRDLSLNVDGMEFFSERIALPWLCSDETCFDAVQTIADVITYFPQESICKIFLHLLKEKESILTKGSYLNDLLISLSDSQKNNLLCYYLEDIASNMQNHHLNIVHALIETTVLTDDSTKNLLDLLLSNIANVNNDRYFGNILLIIAQRLSSGTPDGVIKLMLSLYGQFKGVMRFRIKNLLNAITATDCN